MIFNDLDRVVFAGDSVTDMGRARPIGEGLGNSLGCGYVQIINNMLAAFYPETKIRVTNAGIDGNTSRDLLKRFDSDVLSLNPDWISICIGINDVWRQFDCLTMPDCFVLPDEYEKNIEKMIVSAKDKVKGIFILSPYYMEINKSDMIRKRMDEYTEICKKLADKYNCIFVDFQKMYDKYFSVRHSSYIAWDRVHPNQAGATLMAMEFLKVCDFDYSRFYKEK